MLVLAGTTKTYPETTDGDLSNRGLLSGLWFSPSYPPPHNEVLAEDKSQGRDLQGMNSEVAWIPDAALTRVVILPGHLTATRIDNFPKRPWDDNAILVHPSLLGIRNISPKRCLFFLPSTGPWPGMVGRWGPWSGPQGRATPPPATVGPWADHITPLSLKCPPL